MENREWEERRDTDFSQIPFTIYHLLFTAQTTDPRFECTSSVLLIDTSFLHYSNTTTMPYNLQTLLTNHKYTPTLSTDSVIWMFKEAVKNWVSTCSKVSMTLRTGCRLFEG